MGARKQVVEGLLELVLADDEIDMDVASAIGELGYPEFCKPLYALYLETEDYELIGAYCRCATREETPILVKLLESGDTYHISSAAWAAERLGLTELVPILEKIKPDKFVKDRVNNVIKYLKSQ